MSNVLSVSSHVVSWRQCHISNTCTAKAYKDRWSTCVYGSLRAVDVLSWVIWMLKRGSSMFCIRVMHDKSTDVKKEARMSDTEHGQPRNSASSFIIYPLVSFLVFHSANFYTRSTSILTGQSRGMITQKFAYNVLIFILEHIMISYIRPISWTNK